MGEATCAAWGSMGVPRVEVRKVAIPAPVVGAEVQVPGSAHPGPHKPIPLRGALREIVP